MTLDNFDNTAYTLRLIYSERLLKYLAGQYFNYDRTW
jgi:hypothetical protein